MLRKENAQPHYPATHNSNATAIVWAAKAVANREIEAKHNINLRWNWNWSKIYSTKHNLTEETIKEEISLANFSPICEELENGLKLTQKWSICLNLWPREPMVSYLTPALTWSWGFWRRSAPPQCQWSWLGSWGCPVRWADSPWPPVCPSRPGSWKNEQEADHRTKVLNTLLSIFFVRMRRFFLTWDTIDIFTVNSNF